MIVTLVSSIIVLVCFRYMRMSPERFEHLNSLTKPLLTKRCWNRQPISAEHRLAITLRYLATGDSQTSGAFNFVIGKTTHSRIVREGCSAIWTVLVDKYIPVPRTAAAWSEIGNEFTEQWNFPNVIGALDGKHINIQCPKYGGSDYFNYKGFHSVNLMAMCDAHYRFTWVDIGAYGRDNDASVFGQTEMFKCLDSNKLNVPPPKEVDGHRLPYVVLSDEIFPLKPWLLKPYPGRQHDERQTIFNYRLSRARRTIENTFGILTTKWRIFRRPIIANLDLVELIVKACVALHNYLLLTDNAKYTPAGFVDSVDKSGTIVEGSWRKEIQTGALGALVSQGAHNMTNNAKKIRDKFCDYVNSPVGSVPWQVDYVRHSGTQ